MTKQKLLFAVFAFLMMTACGPTPEELVKQGKEHLDNHNYTEAMDCFQKAAEKGNAEAEYNIGRIYINGLGVEEDFELAADWYKKAAEKGWGEAQNHLALLYFSGNGVGIDNEKAVKWAKSALEQGDYSESMIVMGILYHVGTVLPKDDKKAVDYLERAIELEPNYKTTINEVLFELYLEGDGVQDDEKVVDMLCEDGSIDRGEAMCGLGGYYCYDEDMKDKAKAARWYRKAAEVGNHEAQYELGVMYFNGDGVEKDLVEAATWIRKAAEGGHANAQVLLGTMYAKGEGVAKSMNDAKYWWQKSADQGGEIAKRNLEQISQMAQMANRFSVSQTKQVLISKGNLQYNPSTNKWRFASAQWNYIGDANKNISPNYNGWIDLFGWGTGKNPTKTSMDAGDYSVFNDWGNNNISNGDGNWWRTLTKNEWIYLFNIRNTNSGVRYAMGTVNGVGGIILLPDGWVKSNYGLKNTNDINAKYSSNIISRSDWTNKFEANGAIFLPAAGTRLGTNVQYPGYGIGYWSASSSGNYDANGVWAADGIGGVDGVPSRITGNSVRLVCDYKK